MSFLLKFNLLDSNSLFGVSSNRLLLCLFQQTLLRAKGERRCFCLTNDLRRQPKGNTAMTTPWWNKQGNDHSEPIHQYLGVTERMKENSLLLKTHNHNRKHEADWLQQEKACLVVRKDEEESLSRLMWWTSSKEELCFPMEESEVSFGKSNHHNNSIHLLRITKWPE